MAYKILQGAANLFQALHYADPLTREALQLLLICPFPTYYSHFLRKVFLDTLYQARYFVTMLFPHFYFLALTELCHHSWNCHRLPTYSKRTEMVLISLNATSPGPRIELVPIRY